MYKTNAVDLHSQALKCKFRCFHSGCEAAYVGKQGLNRHILDVHPAEDGAMERYTCSAKDCEETLETESNRAAHLVAVHSRIRCPHPGCTKTFGKTGQLNWHVREEHVCKDGTTEYYPCSVKTCGKTFDTESERTTHLSLSMTRLDVRAPAACQSSADRML